MEMKYPKPYQYRDKWRVRWFDENGTRQSATFDTEIEACRFGKKMVIETQEIKQGIRSPRPVEKSFGDACDYWLQYRAINKRSYKDDVSIIEKHFRPLFGTVALRNFSVHHADQYRTHRANLNPKTIHNHLTLMISILKVCHDLKWIQDVPRIKKPKLIKETDFYYLRNDEEVWRFLDCARIEGEIVFTMYAFAVFSGLREGEIAGLQWNDVDLENRTIVVQRSYNGPTKSGQVRYVPIFDVLLPMLRRWKIQCPGIYVFPNRNGTMHGKSARIFQEVLHRVLKAAKFPEFVRNGKRRRYLVFHDLRHTFASHWMMKGGDIYKLQKMLGHESVETTMKYAHLSPHVFKDDLGRFGQSDRFQSRQADVVRLEVATSR